MALSKCKECGHEISKKAKECPNCGSPQGPKQYSLGKLIVYGLMAWFLYAVFTADYSGNSSTSTASSGRSNPAPPAAPQTPSLEVQSWKCNTEHGYIFVEGEVKNVSNRKLENVVAVGTFRTKSGEHVKTEDALLDYNPILPGQISPFKAGGTTNPQITNCNLTFKYLMGGTIAFTDNKK